MEAEEKLFHGRSPENQESFVPTLCMKLAVLFIVFYFEIKIKDGKDTEPIQ